MRKARVSERDKASDAGVGSRVIGERVRGGRAREKTATMYRSTEW